MGLALGFAVVYIVSKAVVSSAFDRVLDRRGADERVKRSLMKITTLVVTFITLGAGSASTGLGNILQSLTIINAVATLVIGFVIQDVTTSFVAGIFVFTDKPFRIGDWVERGGNVGVVGDISPRVTRVHTFDNELFIVPNSQLTDGTTKDPVAKDKFCLQVPFDIGYDDDIQQTTDIILDETGNHEGIMMMPEPSVRLTELSSPLVTLKSRIWIFQSSRADFTKTRNEYVTVVKERFDEEGIDIPYLGRTLSGELSIGGAKRLAQSND